MIHRKITKLSLALIMFSFLIAGMSSTVLAQESVILDASTSSKTTQKLKERIEKIVEEKKEQIKGIISNLDATKQGFIGEVQRISEETITIKTNKTTRIIPINETVELIKDGEKIELSDIAVENWLVVMGVLEEDTFNPIRILVSAETLRPLPSYITIGGITKIDTNEITVNPRASEETVALTTDRNTVYEDINGEEIDESDIEEDTQALIVALDDDGEKIAQRIRILTVLEITPDNE
jgi:hypothetical protein